MEGSRIPGQERDLMQHHFSLAGSQERSGFKQCLRGPEATIPLKLSGRYFRFSWLKILQFFHLN